MNAVSTAPWMRRAVLVLAVLVALAPLFGWAAGVVGYAEPLENTAEETGAADAVSPTVPGVFPDYSVPGLGPSLETLASAAVGTALTLAVGVGIGRLLER